MDSRVNLLPAPDTEWGCCWVFALYSEGLTCFFPLPIVAYVGCLKLRFLRFRQRPYRLLLWVSMLFFIVGIFSCSDKRPSVIRLPNGDSIQQTSVSNLEKVRKVHFEQYAGFSFEYSDSLFDEALLVITDGEAVRSGVLSENEIQDLKKETIAGVRLRHLLRDNSGRRDQNFEALLKSRYFDYDEKVDLTEGFELKRKGKSYVKAVMYTFGVPNYVVLIYPKK